MTDASPTVDFTFDEDKNLYRCLGSWTTLHLDSLVTKFKETILPSEKTLTITGSIKKLTAYQPGA